MYKLFSNFILRTFKKMVGAGLDVFTGCMFAGKSREALKHISRWKAIRKRVMVIKHALDDRYAETEIATHDMPSGMVECYAVSSLLELRKLPEYAAADVIVIDEAQFFSDLYDFCKLSVDVDKKRVQVFGLDGTANRDAFGEITRLCPIADTFQKISALCGMCGDETPAPFTMAIQPFPEGTGDVLIGGSDIYMAVCRRHYLEHCSE